jgi:hypothetical protein
MVVTKLSRFWWVVGALCGCGAGGQSGTEGDSALLDVQCDVVTKTPVAADQQTEVGMAAELAAALSGSRVLTVHWFPKDGTESSVVNDLTLDVTVDSQSARLVEQRAEDPNNAALCSNYIEIDGIAVFKTTDGAFDERFVGVASNEASAQAMGNRVYTFEGTFPAGEVQGTYDASAVLSKYMNPSFSIIAWFDPEPSGAVDLRGDDADSVPPELIAEFPP